MNRMLGFFAEVKPVRANVKRRIYNFIFAMRAWLKMESNHSTRYDLCIYFIKSVRSGED